MSDPNSVSTHASTSATKSLSEAKRLLAAVTAIIQRYMSQCVTQAFDTLDDSLFEFANSARTNNEQSCFFDAMREIRIKRRSVEDYAISTIPLFIAEPKRVDILLSQKQNLPNELTLLGETELEELVLIDSMSSKVRANFSGELLLSQQRLHNLYETYGFLAENRQTSVTVLDPQVIFRILSQSCNSLEIDAKEKLLVLKHIGLQLQDSYGSPLESTNEFLADSGILPSLKFKSATHSPSESSEPSDLGHISTEPPVTKTDDHQSEVDSQDTYTELQTLLAQARQAELTNQQNSYAGGVGPSYVISESELLNMLSEIQTQRIPDNLTDGRAELIDLRQAFRSALSKGETSSKKKVIDPENEDAINLVSMLFEFILDDYNLSAPIQVLISRLQIPTLKVVIKDPSFFSKPTHPARRLLNALAKAGIGWSDASEKSRDKLYDQIHNIVRKILDDFTGDIALFTKLNDEFQNFLDREGRRTSIIEERTKEAEIGRIKTQKAQSIVKSTLKTIIGSQPIPEVAREILENGWARVMFLSYLKNNKENRWIETTKVAEELIWCLAPHTAPTERERWTRIAPSCIKALKKGLQEVSYNASGLDDSLSQLKSVLAQSFKNPDTTQITTKPAASATRRQETSSQPDSPPSQDNPEFLIIRNMQVGDWIEFTLINGSRFRCKLSAKMEEPDCYIFVNRIGLKVVEKSRQELAADLANGRIAVLEQGLLVDRALDAVVGNLRKLSAKQA